MMEEEYLYKRFDRVSLRPPCPLEIPSSIRGFLLPQEYTDFISNHDGAHLMIDRSVPDLDEVHHVALFSLREIMEGTCYRDPFGGYLGSELTMHADFQNTWPGVRTTANDTPCGEAQKLFERFYQEYLVIGYAWVYWDDPIRRISLLGIDKEGFFVLSDDKHIEHGLSDAWTGTPPGAWRGASLRDLLECAWDSI